MITYTVSLPKTSTNITMFQDDTVETVRMRIGIATGIHPDKLRIYVQSEFPKEYYTKDSRRWESVFLRMSPEGKPIGKPSLDLWSAHTDPSWDIQGISDKTNWMMTNNLRDTDFTELRILGAPEDQSWIYPLDNTSEPPFLPAVSQISIDTQRLFVELHPTKTNGFRVIPHEDTVKPSLEIVYYPFLRSVSAMVVPDEISRSIQRQTDLLVALFDRRSDPPTRQSIVRVRWKIPLVNSEFSRNRFEQIFYGTTVSTQTPTISFFGSRQEQSRHKFYTPSSNPKHPFIDLRVWNYWWTSVKPSKNKASLLFFRGNARFDYDRITITSTDIVVSFHRPPDNNESIASLQTKGKEWIESIDGLISFLDKTDLDETRWVLQDVSASIVYAKDLKHADFRRFDCLRSLFEIVDHQKLVFKLLRASQYQTSLTPDEVRILSLLKENENLSVLDISEEFEDADTLLSSVKEKIGENPDILEKQYSNLPTFTFGKQNVVVTYALDLARVISYIDILRDILLNPDDSSLDSVCPSKMESVERSVAEIAPLENLEEGDLDFLSDLLGDVSAVVKEEAPKEEEAVPAPLKKRVAVKSNTSLATYFLTQMRDFDPETYDPDDPDVLRKCDKPRQPIIMRPEELERIDPAYDPRTTSGAVLDVKDPDGHIVCPAYWCTYDRIPLTEEQITERRVCPVCGGKVRSTDKAVEKKQDVIEYPVIQRDPSIVFPGYVKYKSRKNGRPIPCCFTTKQTTKISVVKSEPSTAEAFYVLGELKSRLGSLRLGYIPRMVGKALSLPLQYKETIASGNRIQAGQSGFYRVGVGHASETLPTVLQVSGSIKTPIQNVDATLRCSFFRTWKGVSNDGDPSIIPGHIEYKEKIAGRVEAIDNAFKHKMLSPLEELEYCALSLDCQLFVLYVGDTVEIGCFMNIGSVRSVNRAVIVMMVDEHPEYICHVARITTVPQFTANIYKSQYYQPTLIKYMIDMRGKACISDIPTIERVITFVNRTPSLKNKIPEILVILDPYGRAQALYIPSVCILPCKPTSQIPTFITGRVTGYADIPDSDLPMKSDMIDLLKQAVHVHPGFAYAHDVTNQNGKIVEIILRSGLRIPTRTEDGEGIPNEITGTVREYGEDDLVWGDESKTPAKSITYEAEVFDFLLYQLSYDIRGEDYAPLKKSLIDNTPELPALLKTWMDDTLLFSRADEPTAFVKKMRSPCSNDDCSGSLCAWSGSTCRVEIKQVRPTLERKKLERRLLSTLVSNEKIRDIVWQNRTSPFFSSVLYLEMPNEIIYSDTDVTKIIKGT